ncbi:MAG: endonuclease/exonuclease/phosphatase family protein [Bdellovibrionota bacterium]
MGSKHAGSKTPLLFRAYLAVILVFFSVQSFADQAGCASAMRDLLTHVSRDTTTPKRSLNEIPELKVATYNTLNLTNSEEIGPNTIKHQQDIARVILEHDLDIVTLQEVSNIERVQNFVDTYLDRRYMLFITAGNDERGIQIAFLVKKDLPFQMKLETHADVHAVYPVTGHDRAVFSRDVPSLSIWADTQNVETDQPLVIFNGTHYKSKRDADGDPESNILRGLQVTSTVDILQQQRRENPESIVMIAGDFNGDVRTDAVFAPLRDTMRDAFDGRGISDDARITHSFHPRNGPTSYSQLDTFFVAPDKADYVSEIFVHRYKDTNGVEKRIPQSWDERNQNPSDHFPVIMKLEFKRLLEERRLLLPAVALFQPRSLPARVGFRTLPSHVAA